MVVVDKLTLVGLIHGDSDGDTGLPVRNIEGGVHSVLQILKSHLSAHSHLHRRKENVRWMILAQGIGKNPGGQLRKWVVRLKSGRPLEDAHAGFEHT